MAVIAASGLSYCLKLSFWEHRALVFYWKIDELGSDEGVRYVTV